jgi:hypothetical protein
MQMLLIVYFLCWWAGLPPPPPRVGVVLILAPSCQHARMSLQSAKLVPNQERDFNFFLHGSGVSGSRYIISEAAQLVADTCTSGSGDIW